jgi:zinc protease
MAHLLEHLLFKGTPTTTNLWAEFTKRGLRANGSTWYDRTNYFADVRRQRREPALVPRLAGRRDDPQLHRPADLDTEMTVVRNEMESGENSPGRILLQQTMASITSGTTTARARSGARRRRERRHPQAAGVLSQLLPARQRDADRLGPFDAGARARDRRARASARSPSRRARCRRRTPSIPAQDGERTVTLRRVGGAPLIYVGYHVPPAASPTSPRRRCSPRCSATRPAALYKQLVEKQLGGPPSASPSRWPSRARSSSARAAPTQDVEKARAALGATVEALAGSEPSPRGARAGAHAVAERMGQGLRRSRADRRRALGGVAEGDWRLYFLGRDQVRKVALADIRRVAASGCAATTAPSAPTCRPAQPERAPAPARVVVAALVKDYKGPERRARRGVRPDARPPRARTQRFVLDSGPQGRALPKARAARRCRRGLRLRFGDVTTLQGQDAVAGLRRHAARQGRRRPDAPADRRPASTSSRPRSASRRTTRSSASTITTRRDRLPAVIELVGRLLREPNFTAPALEEARVQWLTAIERQKKEPDALIRNKLARYGNPYPRGDIRYVGTSRRTSRTSAP